LKNMQNPKDKNGPILKIYHTQFIFYIL